MKRVLTLWVALGVLYVGMEMVFRGRSHPSMLIVGGLCGLLVGSINQHPKFYNAPVVVQAIIGALMVLAVEFISGLVLNVWLGLGVWDYSNQPGNIMGQVCPVFGLLWFLIMPLAIWAEDTANWFIWFYETEANHRELRAPEFGIYTLRTVYREFITGK